MQNSSTREYPQLKS
jgi:hypothetical protein